MRFISEKQALTIHSTMIATFGGEDGIISEDILKQCLEIPLQRYFGEEIYPAIEDKAAAYLYYLVTLHPFVDGNKRTGYSIARIFLLMNSHDFNCSEEDRYNFVMRIAGNEESLETTKAWITDNMVKIDSD
ncbi:MAG: type II toxin-antitoxin system death-on-curing family toxin [Candidatus Odinarchaeota archaeon]